MDLSWQNWGIHLGLANGILVISILTLTIFFSWKTWIRSKRKMSCGLLETFRLLILCLFCLTLLDPEKTEILKSESKPQLAVLIDQSKSMDTVDMFEINSTIKTRIEWAEALIQSPNFKELEKNASVYIQLFSSHYGDTRTDIHDCISSTIDKFPNLHGILLLTDGDSNLGLPVIRGAPKLSERNISLFSIFTGSQQTLPDLDLEHIWAPAFTLKEEKVVVNWRVQNTFKTPQSSTLSLYANNDLVESSAIRLSPSSSQSGNISWLPPKTGKYKMTLKLNPTSGENFQNNNTREFDLRVEEKIIQVLLIDSTPRWEYRFLKNALQRDPGVEVKSLLFRPNLAPAQGNEYLNQFPRNLKEMTSFDVVFLGDIGIGPKEITKKNADLLQELVKNHAGGIVFIPGRKGKQLSFDESSIGDLLPVYFDKQKPVGLGTINPANLELTDRGMQHWLTNLKSAGESDRKFWGNLPGFFWSAIVRKSKPGSEVLATHSNYSSDWGKMPLLVVRHHQAGKALFLGTDSAWRWRRGVEDKYHYRFWSQVVRWMARGRNQASNEGIRLITHPEKPSIGDQVLLHCIAMDQAGFPLESSHINAKIIHQGGVSETLQLTPVQEGKGIYTGSVLAREPGNLTITVSESVDQKKLTTTLAVSSDTTEKQGRPVISQPLSALSEVTGGSSEFYENWKRLLPKLKTAISPKQSFKIHRLRTNLLWGGFLFVLLVIYWTGRKLLGLV